MLENIKIDVKKGILSDEEVFQKYLVQERTWFFHSHWSSTDDEFLLKSDFCKNINVNINDTYVIGSAKTGFSLKPSDIGGRFDRNFIKTKHVSDKSDIDIAIISDVCFEYYSKMLFDYTKGFQDKWNNNQYYKNGIAEFGISLDCMCAKYLARGWLRPDFLPVDFHLGKINEVRERWRKKLSRKVSCAIYKNWYYFKSYQVECIKRLRIEILEGKKL